MSGIVPYWCQREYAPGSYRVDVRIGNMEEKYNVKLKNKWHKSYAECLEEEWK
jgi:hypothetical protein